MLLFNFRVLSRIRLIDTKILPPTVQSPYRAIIRSAVWGIGGRGRRPRARYKPSQNSRSTS
jgi:hypothetical protein